jgi:hypothetical protein
VKKQRWRWAASLSPNMVFSSHKMPASQGFEFLPNLPEKKSPRSK